MAEAKLSIETRLGDVKPPGWTNSNHITLENLGISASIRQQMERDGAVITNDDCN